jgi:formylglycine-generating enzyme required for sulfatase activity
VVAIPAGRIGNIEIPPFEMGVTPVTNREYAAFLETAETARPPWFDDPAFRGPDQPVVGVTWEEAAAYCRWLGRKRGGRWRLPSVAEWEHAARGGLVSPRTPWGDAVPAGEIPEGPLSGPWEAGRGTPNGYGLFDMGTIVHEWCSDWHEADPARPPAIRRRSSRGGSWRHRIRWSAPDAKSSLPPDYRYADYGFRVVREIG